MTSFQSQLRSVGDLSRVGTQYTPHKGATLQFLINKGKITNREYQQLCEVSKTSAFRDINALIERGILKKVGVTGRGTYYTLGETFVERLGNV